MASASTLVPSGRPPRTTRATSHGMQLLAALDEPSSLARPSVARPRSDSTLSTDTFDGIYALGDDDVEMEMDDELDVIDDDVFRPSQDEFGLARTSDLERMLLDAKDDDEDDEAAAVMAHLVRLDSAAKLQRMTRLCAFAPVGSGVVAPSGDMDEQWRREIAAALPPKYLEDGSTQKRRVHKRTFGERTASFRFRFHPASGLSASTSTKTASPRKTAQARRSSRSLFHEAAEDIARRDLDRDEKENLPPTAIAAPHADDASIRVMEREVEEHKEKEIVVESEEIKITLPQLQTPERVMADVETYSTPVRRSSATPSALPSLSFSTPCAPAVSAPALLAPSSMSPTTSFDKVAVVHAKDTPGKVDKFEWTIRPSSLSATASRSDSALPPRYLSDAASSPQKRRVHSSTFGSFARSFSFTNAL